MNGNISTERLMRFLQATPEQQAAIERILGGEPGARSVEHGAKDRGLRTDRDQSSVNSGQGQVASGGAVVAAEPFISKAETAKRLDKDVRTVSTYMRKGWLPYYKMGHTVVFKWSEVEKQLAVMCRVNRSRY